MNYGNLAVQHVDDLVETFCVFEIFEQFTSFRQQSTYSCVQRLFQDKRQIGKEIKEANPD